MAYGVIIEEFLNFKGVELQRSNSIEDALKNLEAT